MGQLSAVVGIPTPLQCLFRPFPGACLAHILKDARYPQTMRSPVPDYLDEVLDQCREIDDGELADYIPELAQADPDLLAAAICVPSGMIYSAGDCEAQFTIQSISKPFTYALALREQGAEAVLSKVGVEPSGDPFNEISLSETGQPRNPMINVGAITTYSLVGPSDMAAEERFEQVRRGLSAFAGRELEVDDAVYSSEMETSDRNMALAHMVRSYGVIEQDPRAVVEGYIRQCSVKVSVRDLAVMAMTLASGGINPLTDEEVVPRRVARQVLSVMSTCGMYDAAGDWMTAVGIPAKSGVSGGVLGALPGVVGAATFSPRLDRYGNSTRGVRVFERLSEEMGMHLMDAAPVAEMALRSSGDYDLEGKQTHRIVLQGAIHFSAAEAVLRGLEEIADDGKPVVFDVTRVTGVNDVGRRMLLEGVRRIGLDGHSVALIDSRDVLPDPSQEGVRVRVIDDPSELEQERP